VTKSDREIMEIFEAFDLTGTAWSAAQLTGCGAMPGDQIATAELELLAAQRHAPLREAFARLPPARQRLLAMLISDPAVPYAEISAKLGIPLGSIGPNRRRYLDRLCRDPAIARLTSTQTAAHGQAAVPACTPSRAGRSRRPRSAGNRGDAGPTCPG
jgi:DNA-directed RNA polymerase specialized sigma24 family protein